MKFKGIAFMMFVLFLLTRDCILMKVTCNTQFSELAHSITVVLCPAGCLRQHSSLCGNQFYTRGPVCLAAIQDQWIDGDGGPVTVYRSPAGNGIFYSGGTRNGVKSESCPAQGDIFSFEMTCATQGNSSQPITQAKCPHGCGKDPAYGSEIYSSDSSVCSAAIHAGLLTEKGGVVTFYKRKGVTNQGSTKNGITTHSYTPIYGVGAFSFKGCSDKKCPGGSTCVELNGVSTCMCPAGYYGTMCESEFKQCWNGGLSGLYSYKSGLEVLCDNGWTVFQRRFDGSVDFQQNWNEYKNGFGFFASEFWWGLEHVYQVVKGFSCPQCQLRVEISDFNGNSGYAEYNHFGLNGESDKYRICVHGYSGNIGDSINPPAKVNHRWNGVRFSTQDQDNDEVNAEFCARADRKHGGSWFKGCSYAVLNGAWVPTRPPGENFFSHWLSFHNAAPLMKTEMKFRCV